MKTQVSLTALVVVRLAIITVRMKLAHLNQSNKCTDSHLNCFKEVYDLGDIAQVLAGERIRSLGRAHTPSVGQLQAFSPS